MESTIDEIDAKIRALQENHKNMKQIQVIIDDLEWIFYQNILTKFSELPDLVNDMSEKSYDYKKLKNLFIDDASKLNLSEKDRMQILKIGLTTQHQSFIDKYKHCDTKCREQYAKYIKKINTNNLYLMALELANYSLDLKMKIKTTFKYNFKETEDMLTSLMFHRINILNKELSA